MRMSGSAILAWRPGWFMENLRASIVLRKTVKPTV
jgi:hypothetical protein